MLHHTRVQVLETLIAFSFKYCKMHLIHLFHTNFGSRHSMEYYVNIFKRKYKIQYSKPEVKVKRLSTFSFCALFWYKKLLELYNIFIE